MNLTDRHCQILQLLADDLTPDEVCQRLFITQATLKTHRKRILLRLGVKSSNAAIAAAMRLKAIQ